MIAYPAIFHRQKHGFWVEFPDLPGCLTEGRSFEDARRMAKEALSGVLGVRLEYDEPIRKASKVAGRNVVWIEPDLNVGVALSLRQYRKRRGQTMRDLARKMNVAVGEVQRLEDPRRSNPTVAKLVQICRALEIEVKDLFTKRAA
ncbi:MAG: type II toxin-antitoxin system HicB family antitoxin [Pseudomonadota bacterium]